MALHDLPRGLRRLPAQLGRGGPGGQPALDPGAPNQPGINFYNRLLVAGRTPQQALPANPARAYLLIQNRGANSVYIVFGARASVGSGLEIKPDGVYEPLLAPASSINVKTASGTANVVFVEGVG